MKLRNMIDTETHYSSKNVTGVINIYNTANTVKTQTLWRSEGLRTRKYMVG